jgi:membrane protease YdiL (CAAX protease family)
MSTEQLPAPEPATGSLEVSRSSLRPVLGLTATVLLGWSAWVFLLHPFLAQGLRDSYVTGLIARLIFWGAPAAWYLTRYWKGRLTQPLGLGFPMGLAQLGRTVLLTLVVGVGLVLSSAARHEAEPWAYFLRALSAPLTDPSAPLLEELLFRGLILSELLNWTHGTSQKPSELRLKYWLSQAVASGAFVLVHFPSWILQKGVAETFSMSVPLLALSLILGFVFAHTRSIWGCIGLHFLNNQLSVLN